MNTNDILLSAALDSSSSRSFIDRCLIFNMDFARTYDKNIYHCQAIPSKHLAIICCMDARLDLYRILGLQPCEVHIIQNGGGRLRDAVRSLICSQVLFGTKETMIIHNTDSYCTYFSDNDQILASLIVQRGTKTDNVLLPRPFYEGDKPDFMPIIDIEQSIRDDIGEYKQYPMLDQTNIVRGFLYDIKTGLLKEIK